jgi:hypothetical protein
MSWLLFITIAAAPSVEERNCCTFLFFRGSTIVASSLGRAANEEPDEEPDEYAHS